MEEKKNEIEIEIEDENKVGDENDEERENEKGVRKKESLKEERYRNVRRRYKILNQINRIEHVRTQGTCFVQEPIFIGDQPSHQLTKNQN